MERKPAAERKGRPWLRLSAWKTSRAVRVLVFLLLASVFYLSVSPKLVKETYDIEEGSISEQEIRAPRMIENQAATLRARAEAAEGVQPVYTVIPLRNDELLELLFDKLEQVNADTQLTSDEKITIYKNEFPMIYREFMASLLKSYEGTHKASLLEEVSSKLAEHEYRIPEETYYKLPRIPVSVIADMEATAKSIVSRLMSDRMTDPELARVKVPELVNASQLASNNEREVVQELVRFVLTPNRFHDEEATKEAKVRASEQTNPIYIMEGDVIVAAGERITAEKYAILEELGLLKSNASPWPQTGTAVISLLFAAILYLFIRQNDLPVASNNIHLFMLVLIFALTTLGMWIVSLAQEARYPHAGLLAPAAMGSILIAILLGQRMAWLFAVLTAVAASVILNANRDVPFDFFYGFVAIVACFVSIFAIHRASQRSALLRAGLLAGAGAALSAVSLIAIGDDFTLREVLFALAFSAAGGLVTAVLVIGLLPFFEVAFGILSPLKLVELSNPNHPLLRKLLTETPGTYHHSVMVGNLSEAAAEAIGANGLLCRVGSFYHDVGKTKRPAYFIENQNNIENPHDHIDPSLSKSIIVAHVRDGVEMLAAHKIPKQIRDIAEQHHGTTVLKYFYHKALKQLEEAGEAEKTVSEEDYRYPGPVAQTREAAIVGIADSVEAAVRSLKNPTPEQIEAVIRKIIKERLDDGQFNECDLTLRELEKIAQSMKETLLGIFHSRIEYPEGAAAAGKTAAAGRE